MSKALPIVRDADYFLEPIFILVENTMFQVTKQHLTNISIFQTIFSLPSHESGVEGLTEKSPLILHQIAKHDFKAFLKGLIPLQILHNKFSNIKVEEWISILKLSTMWEVIALRNLAISHLDKLLDATQMILLGSKYHIPQWFITGCTTLITRTDGPTEAEGDLLGGRSTVKIYRLRERRIKLYRNDRIMDRHGEVDWQVRQAFPDEVIDYEHTSKTS